MDQAQQRIVKEEEVRVVGRYMNTAAGKKVLAILDESFGSELSYTRGESEHTAFLEGQKSLLQWLHNTAKAVKNEEDE